MCLRLPDCIRRSSFAWRALRNAIKGFGLTTNEKSAIVKAGGNPAIPAALDNFANFTLQRHLGFPRGSACNQNDSITNLKTGVQSRFLFHLPQQNSLVSRAEHRERIAELIASNVATAKGLFVCIMKFGERAP